MDRYSAGQGQTWQVCFITYWRVWDNQQIIRNINADLINWTVIYWINLAETVYWAGWLRQFLVGSCNPVYSDFLKLADWFWVVDADWSWPKEAVPCFRVLLLACNAAWIINLCYFITNGGWLIKTFSNRLTLMLVAWHCLFVVWIFCEQNLWLKKSEVVWGHFLWSPQSKLWVSCWS